MQSTTRIGVIAIMILLLVLPLLSACNGGNGTKTPTSTTTTPTPTPTEKVTVTIGNHTDKTGVASNAMQYVDLALADTIEYYNENNLIPGVEVELVEYDGQADPSRDITGYEWLKQRGADLMTAWFPAVATTLRSYIDADEIVLFGTIARKEILYPPGYLFITSALLEDTAWTTVKWLMENDWDYQTNGPAKIGGVCWSTDNCDIYYDTFEKYAEMYPEQLEFVSGHIAPAPTFSWPAEVEALKDCDYIWVPNVMGRFVMEYRQAGYTGTFLGSNPQLAFFNLIEDMGIWEELDGSLFIIDTEWWDEQGEVPDFVNKLVREKNPDSFEEVIRAGKSYFGVINSMGILEIIKSAAEAVGPENLDSQAIYDAAQSFTLTLDGLQRHSFSETKRTSVDRVAMYMADATQKTIVSVSDWLPVETAP